MKRLILIALIITAAFSACKKLDGPGGSHDRLKGILLGKDTLEMYVGQVRFLPITTNPAGYDTDSLNFKSSDSTVLTISKVGTLTAKKIGASIVSVSNLENTISVNVLVTVVAAPVDSLKIGLIAYYPFNNSTADSSGNKFNGTAHDLTATTNRFGTANSAYYFNGTSSYVSVPDNYVLRLGTSDITLSAWIKLDRYGPTYGENILTKHYTGNDRGWAWGITGYSVNPLGVITYGPGGGSAYGRGLTVVDTTKWHLVTTVYDRTQQQVSLYVDGVIDNVVGGIRSPNAAIDAEMCIGRDNPGVSQDGYFVQGALDEIRIYNRILSGAEVKKLYLLNK